MKPPSVIAPAQILGAVYVLEGSRLGGAVLKKALDPTSPRRFLAAPQPRGAWRDLGAQLDAALGQPAVLEAAIDTARLVFDVFYEAGLRQLRPLGRQAA